MSDTGFYDSNFGRSADEVLRLVRAQAFLGEDFGQFSWITAEEHRRMQRRLSLGEHSCVLEVASGSGGPALFLARCTGCTVVGLDVHEGGVASANAAAHAEGLDGRVSFLVHDARDPLPFGDGSFDAVVCIDSINHIFDRLPVFREWHRVLTPGGAAWYTDPVVLVGPLRREELMARSPSMGEFVFTPNGHDELLLLQAGFARVTVDDLTAEIAGVAHRWHSAREDLAGDLERIEGHDGFAAFQGFLSTVGQLASEGRLGRYAMTATKEGRRGSDGA